MSPDGHLTHLDPARVEDLTGPQRGELNAALCATFSQRRDFARFLLYQLGRRLENYPCDGQGLEDVLYIIIESAYAEGWLFALISAAYKDRPNSTPLARFVHVHLTSTRVHIRKYTAFNTPPIGHSPEPHLYSLANTAHFDLATMDEAMYSAMQTGETVVAFGVEYVGETFLSKLCDRIIHRWGDVWHEVKKPTLDPVTGHTPQKCLKIIARFIEHAGEAMSICVVRIDTLVIEDGSHSIADDFWKMLQSSFSSIPGRLIVLFAGRPGMRFPDGVLALPSPHFRHIDVYQWTSNIVQELVATHAWPAQLRQRLGQTWCDWLCADAAVDSAGGPLDIELLYDAMDATINQLHISHHNLRHELEQRARNADAPSG
ncbi:effector-associated domain EAD1-containing protein [Frankia sp. R82]|uniref:effector-associated domain EAD1-containing protein n=1 Tax=Frankia sp. R82 TaxID=2950553 RepID=UPI0020430B9C|nr:effector-associated domain EAD1-containing protein [Frankia sp. R82]MCM3886458.1 effector-associated domain EAD1-containing protein [Frankia sp. R82]